MPIYVFRHPKTGEEFEEMRSFADREKPFHSPDGWRCDRVLFPTANAVIDKNAEVWEKDPSYVKSLRPKYVRTRSGKRIRYDPTKHS